ncbi:MAG TPA: pyridoxamine 5'-phosphate oxidase family protein, partial [Acidimicrobiia bacterium]|nr:pyridoxamine 5'-phosphate oxidase family protein [Acidimicrobiia bacterium]
MSISVELAELRAAIADTDRAPYLVTVSDDGRAHTVAVAPQWDGDELAIAVGRHTAANARARPAVSLLWPPKDRAGYSLIVDAE